MSQVDEPDFTEWDRLLDEADLLLDQYGDECPDNTSDIADWMSFRLTHIPNRHAVTMLLSWPHAQVVNGGFQQYIYNGHYTTPGVMRAIELVFSYPVKDGASFFQFTEKERKNIWEMQKILKRMREISGFNENTRMTPLDRKIFERDCNHADYSELNNIYYDMDMIDTLLSIVRYWPDHCSPFDINNTKGIH